MPAPSRLTLFVLRPYRRGLIPRRDFVIEQTILYTALNFGARRGVAIDDASIDETDIAFALRGPGPRGFVERLCHELDATLCALLAQRGAPRPETIWTEAGYALRVADQRRKRRGSSGRMSR